MFSSIGPLEIGLVLLIVLIIFGPKRLPGLGKQIGTGMREFKDSITGDDKDKDEEKELAERGALASAPAAPDLPVVEPVAEPAPVASPSTGETERSTGLGDERS